MPDILFINAVSLKFGRRNTLGKSSQDLVISEKLFGNGSNIEVEAPVGCQGGIEISTIVGFNAASFKCRCDNSTCLQTGPMIMRQAQNSITNFPM